MRKDIAVLNLLRRNGRMSLAHMSRLLRMPLSTTFAVYKRIQPYVQKYTSLLRMEHLHPLSMIYICTLSKDEEANFVSRMRLEPNVNTCLSCHNRVYLLEVFFKHIKEKHLFEQSLTVHYVVHPVIEELAREQFLIES